MAPAPSPFMQTALPDAVKVPASPSAATTGRQTANAGQKQIVGHQADCAFWKAS